MKVFFGMTLLVLGGGLAAYAFNAPDSVNPHLSGILVGVPTFKTVALLWGGSAVAVVGGKMALAARE
jgi:hypothetical protein